MTSLKSRTDYRLRIDFLHHWVLMIKFRFRYSVSFQSKKSFSVPNWLNLKNDIVINQTSDVVEYLLRHVFVCIENLLPNSATISP